jgi:hypothetical protein
MKNNKTPLRSVDDLIIENFKKDKETLIYFIRESLKRYKKNPNDEKKYLITTLERALDALRD